MRFDFKKIASVLASAVMLGSTAGIALAANYPAPMVTAGAANGAIVITSGSHSGSQVDFWAAIDLQSSLQSFVTAGGVTTEAGVSGEAYPLFTSSTKIYYNDSINRVKDTLTDTELPTILADTEFSGNKDADITHTITLTSWPYVTFEKQPTTSEDPVVGLKLQTSAGKDLYNLTISLDQTINFSHTDSEGETIKLFGQTFTIGVDTDDDELYMYRSSQTLELSVGGDSPNPSQTATVEGKEYTIALYAATDTSATVKVTDADGKTDTKEINEGDSKKILDIEVGVNLADESTATSTLSAEVTVGAQKVRLKDGDEVKVGSDEDPLDGTKVDLTNNAVGSGITKIVIQITAPDSSNDAIVPGGSFVDPIFGTFKVDFTGLNIDRTSSARETLEVKTTQDTATLKMMTHTGDEKVITWYNNESGAAVLADADRDYIRVLEMTAVNESEYVVVGNEDEGHLLEVDYIYNSTGASGTEHSKDEVRFKDVFSGKTYSASILSEGGLSDDSYVTIGGKQYTVYYTADKVSKDSRAFFVRLQYPDSTGASAAATEAVIYPTIQTSKGAKVAFVEPLMINLTGWDGGTTLGTNNLTKLKFPDGDGYQDLTIAGGGSKTKESNWTLSGIATVSNTFGTATNFTYANVTDQSGQVVLTYNISTGQTGGGSVTDGGANTFTMMKVQLFDSALGKSILVPSLVIFEEEDDNNDRHALIVEMEGAGTSADEVGVEDVEMTGGGGGKPGATAGSAKKTISDYLQLESDDDLYEMVDLWGSFVTIDKSESSQYTATISYPDEQIYAQIYAGEVAASITAGVTTGGGGQILVVKDSEVSSVSNRNLVVVGGSCINSVAAKVLGVSYPTCGADFTAKTNVGAGQYLIKAVASPYNSEKTAVLVAGYEAADTKNAAAKLKETHVTDVGTENIYPLTAA